jgi:sugar lactone lactonase YvrE
VAAGLFGPAALLRIGGGQLCWIDRGDTIRCVARNGGVVRNVVTGMPAISDLATDGSFVYVAEQGTGRIRKVSVAGGTVTTLAAGLSMAPVALAVDATSLYWIDPGRIGKVVLADESAQVLAIGLSTDPGLPNAIAVDATALYWTETGSGTIKRSEDR